MCVEDGKGQGDKDLLECMGVRRVKGANEFSSVLYSSTEGDLEYTDPNSNLHSLEYIKAGFRLFKYTLTYITSGGFFLASGIFWTLNPITTST